MTNNTSADTRILGSLRAADGTGVVRIEDRYDTDIGRFRSARRKLLELAGQAAAKKRPGN